MDLAWKEDWEEARARIDAWWAGEVLDRVCMKVTAPRRALGGEEAAPGELESYWLDPERVIPRLRRQLENTWWGGEAFPVMFPLSTGIPAILGAYLGCPVKFINTDTGWEEPILEEWKGRRPLRLDAENRWWKKTMELVKAAGPGARGQYYLGCPDFNGPGEAVARLRGAERLAVDLLDEPDEVKKAVAEANQVWWDAYRAFWKQAHTYVDGYNYWMGIWSDAPSTDLQCDFSCMISTPMFEEFFLGAIEEQTRWVGRTIYHLDGPGAIRHLDALLGLPRLSGIQWVPGAGAPKMSQWIELLQKIQAAGKRLFITCGKEEVEKIIGALRPEGLLIGTHCSSVEEGRALLKMAERATGHGKS